MDKNEPETNVPPQSCKTKLPFVKVEIILVKLWIVLLQKFNQDSILPLIV